MIEGWAEEVLEECHTMFGKITSAGIYTVCDVWQDSDGVSDDVVHTMTGVRATAVKMAKDKGIHVSEGEGSWLYCQTCKKEQPVSLTAWWKKGRHVHLECGHEDALYDGPNPPMGCPCCGTPECDRCF
jgi:hypothetical protein